MPRVVLKITPWNIDHASTLEDSTALLVSAIEIEGKEVTASSVSINLEGGKFGIRDFLTVEFANMAQDDFDRLTPDDYTWKSTPELATVVVTNLQIEIVDYA